MGCLRFGRHFGCGEFAVFFDLFMVWNIVFFLYEEPVSNSSYFSHEAVIITS